MVGSLALSNGRYGRPLVEIIDVVDETANGKPKKKFKREEEL